MKYCSTLNEIGPITGTARFFGKGRIFGTNIKKCLFPLVVVCSKCVCKLWISGEISMTWINYKCQILLTLQQFWLWDIALDGRVPLSNLVKVPEGGFIVPENFSPDPRAGSLVRDFSSSDILLFALWVLSLKWGDRGCYTGHLNSKLAYEISRDLIMQREHTLDT